jgi:OmpA-OmpF porin, OOP family
VRLHRLATGHQHWPALAIALASALCGRSASAEATSSGFALNRTVPAPGSAWFLADSLDFRGQARVQLGLLADFSQAPLVLLDENGGVVAGLVQSQLYYHGSASISWADRLRLALNVPFLLANQGGTVTLRRVGTASNVVFNSPDGAGFGDPSLGLDVRVAGARGAPFALALGGRFYAALGNEARFASDGLLRFDGHVLATGQSGPWIYAAEAGVQVHGEQDDFAALPYGRDLTFGAAAGLSLLGGRFTFGPELSGRTTLSDFGRGFFEPATTPVELLLGGKVGFRSGIRLGVAGGGGVSSGLGAAQARVLVGLTWAAPVSDSPAKPPVGAPTLEDADWELEEKTAACAVCTAADVDHDGVPDSTDACPQVGGVAHLDPKQNGCPLDSDGDGVPDAADACPMDPVPEATSLGAPGCPMARIVAGHILLGLPIRFAESGATLLTESRAPLEAAAELLRAHTEITLLSIEGHTDGTGVPEANQLLSEQRALAVMDFLYTHGVAAERLVARGMGSSRPVASDSTPEGRSRNRRVELVIARRRTP